MDLSKLPAVRDELQLYECELTDLTGLPETTIRTLELNDLQELTSLSGIEVLNSDKMFRTLRVFGCPA